MKIFKCMIIIFAISITNFKASDEKIAVVSDAHVLDVKNQFEDSEFKGIYSNDEYYTIRSMNAQLNSTRLFNENYFAFLSILEDLADEGIKLVLFTGDLTDDGQKMNLEFVEEILKHYQETYQMEFLILPGNHEPVSPYNDYDTWDDFLDEDGNEIAVSSNNFDCQINCTNDLVELGYEEMFSSLKNYGYTPKESYKYYDTPYSSYNYHSYDYQTALVQSDVSNRKYEMCSQGTGGEYIEPGYTNCEEIFDMTYVVEPIDDVLILMVDGNVFSPNQDGYDSPSSAGYNKMITHKKQTLEFIDEISTLAKDTEKTLITATHYPVVDFYDSTSEVIVETFGADGLEMSRNPQEETSAIVSDLGVGLHLSGHLHYNDTGVYEGEDNYMVNVGLSSTAGYVPSYKVITIQDQNVFEIETRVIKDVENFDSLFDFYRKELNTGQEKWDGSILEVENYLEFTEKHLEFLAKNRHFQDWSLELQEVFKNMNLYQIFCYTNSGMSAEEYLNSDFMIDEAIFQSYLVEKETLESIEGMTVVEDFYKILTADQLALKYFDENTIKAYSFIYSFYKDNNITGLVPNIFYMMYEMSNDYPSENFIVDINNKSVTDISNQENKISYLKPVKIDTPPLSDNPNPKEKEVAKKISPNESPYLIKTGTKSNIALLIIIIIILKKTYKLLV